MKRMILIVMIIMLTLTACKEEPVKIVVLGTFSMSGTTFAKAGLQGAELALLERGVKDNYELIPLDLGGYEEAQEVVEAIMATGGDMVLGPFLSSELIHLYEALQENEILTLIPTSSVDEIYGIDDSLFRINNPTFDQARQMAWELQKEPYDRIALLYDENNKSFSKTYIDHLWTSEYLSQDKLLKDAIGELPMKEGIPRLEEVIQADKVVIIADGRKSGLAVQILRQWGFNGKIYLSGWAHNQDLLNNIGSFGQDVYLFTNAMGDDPKAYEDFASRYEQLYLEEPSTFSFFSYESMILLDNIYQTHKTLRKDDFKNFFSMKGEYKSELGSYILQEKGDAFIRMTLLTIDNGQFIIYNKSDYYDANGGQ